MGSKRELLYDIRGIINKQDLRGKAILDLFAGTCGVGMALRDVAPIYSNDIQIYSSIIAKGTISLNTTKLNKDQILVLIEKKYKQNYDAILSVIPKSLKKSQDFSSITTWTDTNRHDYIKFANKFAKSVLHRSTTDSELSALTLLYKQRQQNPHDFPYIQTTALFSEMYFSATQAASIDSIRYAIDQLGNGYEHLKDALVTSLIHAYSYASAGTGHFAQFRDLSTLSSIRDVFIYRKKSILDLFLRKAEEILSSSYLNKYAGESVSLAADYMDVLGDNKITKNVGIIYADPPYSFVHYSRFYHAIEDLCRYDYPDVEHKGRYRKDRHQSPFCIKSKAPKAFDNMFKLAYKNKLPLLVSYSNTGMISLETLDNIARSNGYIIDALEVNHKHSTMGRLKDKHRDVKEALLLCSITK